MAKASINQFSFNRGEIDPALHGRADWKHYFSGAAGVCNMVTRAQGGAAKRGGLRMVARALSDDAPSRLIPFRFSARQSYMLEFGHHRMRVIKDGGVVAYPSGHSLAGREVIVPTPYPARLMPGVGYAQSADIMIMTHRDHPPQRLSRRDHHDWRFENLFSHDRTPAPANLRVADSGGDNARYVVTAAAPFRSLRAALDILARRQAFSAFDLYFHINPGAYPEENLTLTLPLLTSGNVSINAADPADKPILTAAGLHCHGNQAVYLNNLDLRLSGPLAAHRGCHLHASGVDIALTAPGLIAAHAESGAFLHLGGHWTLDGGGQAQGSLFYAERHSLIYLLPGSRLTLVNLPALARAAVADDFSTINTVGALHFPAGIAGRRYEVYYRSYIRTYGAGEHYFPGDTAGYAQTEAGASYY